MKQIVGFLLILCCFPLLVILGRGIETEFAAAKFHEKKIQQQIQLPEVTTPFPITMLDGNGKLFNEEYIEWRQPLKLKDIPEIAKQLFLLSEDKEFYNHIGFNLSAITRAVVVNSNAQTTEQGGSTITQQLVRMRYLSEEKTYERKLSELFYAYELEQMYDKENILEMYLNEMYFSNQVYGIGAAATYYFQKPLSQLSTAQIAFIAAIPNNPSLYDPLKNFDHTKKRQERLLDILSADGVISTGEAKTYKQEEIILNVKEKKQSYPSYSTYVLHEFKSLIASSEGLDDKIANASTKEEKELLQKELDLKYEYLLNSGIIIETALNPTKQLEDEKSINSLLGPGSLQGSATVIDNATREIVSIYGGKDYKKFEFHRAYQGVRQPGSSFKPLIVYAPLFETTSYTPSSIVSGGSFCIGNFCPQNYGNAVYGNVSIATAFKYSYNTSAVRLLQTIGLETAFQYLDRFGFNSIIDKDKTYAAGLGGLTYGVTTFEMANAYTSFIDGTYKRVRSIRRVTDLQGNLLYSWPTESETVWSDHTVSYIRSLLNEVVSSGTGRGIYTNSSYIGAKTGTTNDFKDYWLAGLSDKYTAAVWIGYDIPKSMQHLENDQIHFKIFNKIVN